MQTSKLIVTVAFLLVGFVGLVGTAIVLFQMAAAEPSLMGAAIAFVVIMIIAIGLLSGVLVRFAYRLAHRN